MTDSRSRYPIRRRREFERSAQTSPRGRSSLRATPIDRSARQQRNGSQRYPGAQVWEADFQQQLLMARAQSPVCGFEVATFCRALPPDCPPATPGTLRVAGAPRPAGSGLLLGGDFYEVAALDCRTALLAVGDVCGHGPCAAAQAVKAKAALEAVASQGIACPARILQRLNGFLFRDLHAAVGTARGWGEQNTDGFDRFTALALAVANGRTGRVRLSCAGMEAPLILRAQTGAVELTDGNGLTLGMWDRSVYAEQEYALEPGDLLVLMTDGITEARPCGGRLFGMERVREILSEERALWRDPYRLGERLLAAVADHCGGEPTDDQCLVIARWDGPGDTGL